MHYVRGFPYFFSLKILPFELIYSSLNSLNLCLIVRSDKFKYLIRSSIVQLPTVSNSVLNALSKTSFLSSGV